jgi:hypothetical protein
MSCPEMYSDNEKGGKRPSDVALLNDSKRRAHVLPRGTRCLLPSSSGHQPARARPAELSVLRWVWLKAHDGNTKLASHTEIESCWQDKEDARTAVLKICMAWALSFVWFPWLRHLRCLRKRATSSSHFLPLLELDPLTAHASILLTS